MPLRGFKYRFYPTAEQEVLLRRTIGCCRLVYNRALHERSEAWTSGKKSIGYAAQSTALTGWKKEPELAFLNEVSSVPVQQTLRHLQTGYANFFAKRAKYPSFKRKHSGGSAEFLLGVVALVAGFLLVPLLSWGDTGIEEPEASEPLTSPAAPSSASATTGGLVLVGPVPIFFGSWRNVSTRTRLWVAIAGALVLVLFVVGFLVATR